MWAPLSLDVIKNIPAGRSLYCKVDLFEGNEAGKFSLIDKKYVQMFKKYFDYDKYFYLKSFSTGDQYNAGRESDIPEGQPGTLPPPGREARAGGGRSGGDRAGGGRY